MRTSRFVLASVFLSLGIAALMSVGLKPALDFNPMRSIGRSVTAGFQLPVNAVSAIVRPAAGSVMLSDPEAAGDMADAEEATFRTRFAAAEQK